MTMARVYIISRCVRIRRRVTKCAYAVLCMWDDRFFTLTVDAYVAQDGRRLIYVSFNHADDWITLRIRNM